MALMAVSKSISYDGGMMAGTAAAAAAAAAASAAACCCGSMICGWFRLRLLNRRESA